MRVTWEHLTPIQLVHDVMHYHRGTELSSEHDVLGGRPCFRNVILLEFWYDPHSSPRKSSLPTEAPMISTGSFVLQAIKNF